jgi:hypothetical protein
MSALKFGKTTGIPAFNKRSTPIYDLLNLKPMYLQRVYPAQTPINNSHLIIPVIPFLTRSEKFLVQQDIALSEINLEMNASIVILFKYFSK